MTRIIPVDRVEATQQHIERYGELQRLWHEYIELNVRICDALLEDAPGESDGPEGG